MDDFRLMIEAARDACLRRRKLVFKFYEMQDRSKEEGSQLMKKVEEL